MATYHVVTEGADSNAGTLISPWATIDYALAQMCEEDMIKAYFKEIFEEVKK